MLITLNKCISGLLNLMDEEYTESVCSTTKGLARTLC